MLRCACLLCVLDAGQELLEEGGWALLRYARSAVPAMLLLCLLLPCFLLHSSPFKPKRKPA